MGEGGRYNEWERAGGIRSGGGAGGIRSVGGAGGIVSGRGREV